MSKESGSGNDSHFLGVPDAVAFTSLSELSSPQGSYHEAATAADAAIPGRQLPGDDVSDEIVLEGLVHHDRQLHSPNPLANMQDGAGGEDTSPTAPGASAIDRPLIAVEDVEQTEPDASDTTDGPGLSSAKPKPAATQATEEKPFKYKPSPLDKAPITPWRWWDAISFAWCNPLFRVGAKRQLQETDFFQVAHADEANHLTTTLDKHWQEELKKPNGSLVVAFIKTFGRLWFLASFLLLVEAIIMAVEPYLLGFIVENLENDGPKDEAWEYAGGLIGGVLLHMLIHHVVFCICWRMGYKFIAASSGLIFKKTMSISKQSLARVTTGYVVNLLSNDVERFVHAAVMMHFLYLGPIQAALAAYFISERIGNSTAAGMSVLFIGLPLNMLMSKVYARLRDRTAKQTDERVKTVSEVLSGIRVLKMYAWEQPFSKLVQTVRNLEMHSIRHTNIIRSCNMSFFFVAGALTSFVSFITYELVEGELTASKVFTVIGLFNAIRLNMAFFFPAGVQSLSELRVVFRRIERLLRLADTPAASAHDPTEVRVYDPSDLAAIEASLQPATSTAVKTQTNSQAVNGTTTEKNSSFNGEKNGLTGLDTRLPSSDTSELSTEVVKTIRNTTEPVVAFDNVTTAWVPNRPVLKDVSFAATKGQLVAVVGKVGAGKSSLLMTALGELLPTHGRVYTRGSIGYSAQEAWILSDTVKNNILFGHPFDEEKFNTVIQACQLSQDLRAFSNGSETRVGERGITLSGGQKARISLARAVYADADVYLLDDPLSAVDAKVGRLLVDKCICGPLLEQKTRILVTHQLQFLRKADHIIVLGDDGSIVDQGTFGQLTAGSSALVEIMKEYEAHHHDHEDDHDHDNNVEHGVAGKEVESQEHRKMGVIGAKTYWRYATSAGPTWAVIGWLLLGAASQIAYLMTDWWLSYWMNMNVQDRQERINIVIYGVLLIVLIVLAFTRGVLFMKGAAVASRHLNHNAFKAVVAAPVRFFDTNPIGRILNRFSKDMGYIDDLLPMTLFDFLQLSFILVGTVLLIGALNPFMFLAAAPLIALFVLIVKYYMKTGREIKRLEAVARSPVYSHFSACLQGLDTLRSHGACERFTEKFHDLQNGHGRAYSAFVTCSRWLGFRLDMISFSLVAATIVISLAVRDQIEASSLGLMVVYALQVTNMFQWAVRQFAELENQMTSVERVFELSSLQKEEEFVHSPSEDDADKSMVEVASKANWPGNGSIVFDDLRLRYAPEEPERLKGVSLRIPPGSKIGIVGRTGAGKSSLIAALFRLAPCEGRVLLDGLPTDALPLQLLRRGLGVIPQDPTLFSGSVRHNLDPFNEFADEAIWNALEQVQLRPTVEKLEGGLEAPMAEAGGNFSVGQRQLVCLARAILRSCKVLIMDEATANVDVATDRLIQKTLREGFANSTVLIIAHRLNTILHCDKILVMDDGRAAEFDSPHRLYHGGGLFAQLVRQANLVPLLLNTSPSGQEDKDGRSSRNGASFDESVV